METLIIIPMLVALWWFYRIGNNNSSNKNSFGFKKIDDKHFIIDNEFVSFDENDDLHKMKQEMEDDNIWFEYVRYRQTEDYKYISDQWYSVVTFPNYKEVEESVTDDDITKNKEKYQKYLKDCEVVKFDTPLSERQFVMLYKEPLLFCLFYIRFMFPARIYELHSPDNAKYRDGMIKTLEKEYENKYYKNK